MSKKIVKKMVDYEVPDDEEKVFKVTYNCYNCGSTFIEEYGKDIVVGCFLESCQICNTVGFAFPVKKEPINEEYKTKDGKSSLSSADYKTPQNQPGVKYI